MLWNLDLAFADVVATSSLAELGAIRLAWWRERLDELDAGVVPAEPRLQAVAAILIPHGVSGHELSFLEDCWLPLLQPFPWSDDAAEGLEERGRILFGVAARLLGRNPAEAKPFGAIWSLIDGARHCTDADSRRFLIERARGAISELPKHRIPGELRPLTMIAASAAHEVLHDGRGGWNRLASDLRHSMFGIMPPGR